MESRGNSPKSRYDRKQGVDGISTVSFDPLALVNIRKGTCRTGQVPGKTEVKKNS